MDVLLQLFTTERVGAVGIGFTVITKEVATPAHPPLSAITEIVAEMGLVPLFVAVNEGKLPDPFDASPTAVLLLVQLKVAPAGVELKVEIGIMVPSHTVIFATEFTLGV